MASLEGTTPAATFRGLLKTEDNQPLPSSGGVQVTDGEGNLSPLFLGQNYAQINGQLGVGQAPEAGVGLAVVSQVKTTTTIKTGLISGGVSADTTAVKIGEVITPSVISPLNRVLELEINGAIYYAQLVDIVP